jgi:predicted Zn-dependent protease with MMP-like domain
MIRLSREEFEAIAEETFAHLPATFRDRVDNVVIVVQDYPAEEDLRAARIRSKYHLLGLYSGISYPHRSVWYGMSPVTPDVIKLFQRNIEDLCTDLEELKGKIAEVLLHELGHYFGMSEEEIRRAQRE